MRLVLLFLSFLVCGFGSGPKLRIALSTDPLKVVEIPVENYLVGVLAEEIPADWPVETLKAQAVASRTYALYRKNHPANPAYDIKADHSDQMFYRHKKHNDQLKKAVRETSGEVLYWGGEPIPAFFHSCCGGTLEKASNVWNWAGKFPFFDKKSDPFCKGCPNHTWEYEIEKKEMEKLLQDADVIKYDLKHIVPLNKKDGDRVHRVNIITEHENVTLQGNRFREIIGYQKIKSTAFNVLELADRILFIGSGSGHGVGLCQWGAREMAREGKSYREILEFYYPGVLLKKIY